MRISELVEMAIGALSDEEGAIFKVTFSRRAKPNDYYL